MKSIVDGNIACSKVAYLMSEICSIYPITPSSPMASNIDLLAEEHYNLFHEKTKVVEMQSEAGAAGTLHGALITGSLATTFTSSQGLLLMIPNMYKIAGEMLPAVIHCASRSLATHALSIFGDHQDIYATRATGFCLLSSFNVEQANHLAAVAHLSAIEGSLPFLHFFDGFRTSHETNTVNLLEDEDLLKIIPYAKITEFKNNSLNNFNSFQKGLAENEDIYFQSTEARNLDYEKVPDIVHHYMQKINEIMQTDYAPFNYYGHPQATEIIIAMGSVIDTIKLVVDKLNETKKVGVIGVHLYRPFSLKYLESVLPETTQKIAVLDRTKEFSQVGEPLYLDVVAALKEKNLKIVGGRYGLSSKNTTPADINAVFKMLENELKDNFTIGIKDDVTNLSLPEEDIEVNLNCEEIKIYGFGSDGLVSASKDLLKIINLQLNKYVQGYYEYDSKKSGGVTVSNLRISDQPINAPYYVTKPNILVVTKDEYFLKYQLLAGLKDKGTLLINTNKKASELNAFLPSEIKKALIAKNIQLYYLDAEKIARENNIKGKINKIMEIIILKLLNVPEAEKLVKESIVRVLSNKGKEIVQNNLKALENVWVKVQKLDKIEESERIFDHSVQTVLEKINAREGNSLTVKDLREFKTGTFPLGYSQKEKRNISDLVPKWIPENCIQCGICSLVCPHAVIRPIVFQDKTKGIEVLGNKDYNFQIIISKADCTGCGLCLKNCPGKQGKKALEWQENDKSYQIEVNEYFYHHENDLLFDKYTIKGSQLCQPRFEFSGACAGCGETPYLKLLTQLYQDKLLIANATGCSSIYGGSAPSTPYTINWANSLFEDNAEFAYGMYLTYEQKRLQIKNIIDTCLDSVENDTKNLFQSWLDNSKDYEITREITNALKEKNIPHQLRELLPYLTAKTIWAIGGDGWAYDIGFGGLDHILSSNENIKVLVLDTEVYSNTGGQTSKASQLGQVAEFANFGKKTVKKDLFRIAMSYPNCYVASISLGANYFQTIKAFKEAEEHVGPSLIIAYSPCVEQGIKGGMSNATEQQKLAVEVGYTLLMRYNPREEKLYLDYKEPDYKRYAEFLNNEIRYRSLMDKDPKLAQELLEQQKRFSEKRYDYYQNLVK